MKGQFTVKYLIFREIWKIPCVVPKSGIVVDFGKKKKHLKKAPFQGKKAHF